MEQKLSMVQEEYFKNSQVRNRRGEMLTVYHGSKTRDFDAFQYDPARQTGADFGEAYYFTTDRESAQRYAYDQTKDNRIIELNKCKETLFEKFDGRPGLCNAISELKIHGMSYDDIIAEADYERTGGEVHAVYLDLRNPYVFDAEMKPFDKVYSRALFDEIKAQGYDGIIALNVQDTAIGQPKITDGFIAFYPDQIKSVDNLYPTHSRNFKDNSLDYRDQHWNELSPQERTNINNHYLSTLVQKDMRDRERDARVQARLDKERKIGRGDGFDGPGGR